MTKQPSGFLPPNSTPYYANVGDSDVIIKANNSHLDDAELARVIQILENEEHRIEENNKAQELLGERPAIQDTE